ncbi:MAG: hypothetical protein U0797_17335 [Gemmataceae bacterium]
MLRWPIRCAAAVLLAIQSPLLAQIPGVPAIPGAGSALPGAASAIPGAATAPAAAPAAANNIWSKLCMTPEQAAACKQKLCNCSLVQFLSGGLAPISALSGGLIGTGCPGPNQANPQDLLQPSDSALGAAARIKKLEAEAAARRAAVRYLGTVDCRRFPEAEAALISSLRGDENECVRYEAALALGSGCCCTKKVLEALVVVVSGRKTNDPAEASARVRAAAAKALERCLLRYCEQDVLTPGAPPEKAVEPAVPAKGTAAADPLVEDGKQVLAAYKAKYVAPRPTAEPPVAPPAAVPPPVAQAVAQLKSAAPPAAVSTAAPPEHLPPTGRRDLWSVFQHARR